MPKQEINTIARIENTLIFHAEYQLTAKEQKVMLYLISSIDPVRQNNFQSQVISLKNLESVLMSDKKNGSFYKEIKNFAKRMVKKGIEFTTEVEIDGEFLSGYINWFQSIVPTKNDGGEASLKFKFSEDLKPFLLELKEYTQIDYVEVLPLHSGFSIRLFQLFRAYRNRMGKHQKRSVLKYELEELKGLLGVAGKYADYRNFRLKILEVMQKEINKHTSIGLKYKPYKEGRKVVGVEFEIWDSKARKKKMPKLEKGSIKFDALSFAQVKAYDMLVSYGVTDGIALEMLSKLDGSEIAGFEDWYFAEVIRIFESKTNQATEGAKAGTLVIWFLKKKIFEQGDHFATVMERLQARKKKLQTERLEAWENRLIAKTMTSSEFTKRFNN